jgi:hypothetical protein
MLIVTATILLSLVVALLQQQQGCAQAQSYGSTTFIPYTNTELGYSINYPSDWIIQHFPFFSTVYISSADYQALVVITVTENHTGKNMTFQDMLKNDPQGNSTAEHRTVDATGNIHLLGQPARRIELSYMYTDPITKVSTPPKSMAYETVVSGKHIAITMSASAIDFDKYASIFTQMLSSFNLD